MKIKFYGLLFMLLVACQNHKSTTANKLSVNDKVDSLFSKSFSVINSDLANGTILNKNNRNFIFLCSYLSGIEIHMKSGYIGDVDIDLQKLHLLENWYKKSRSKISWDKVQKGLLIMNKDSITINDIQDLKKLKVN